MGPFTIFPLIFLIFLCHLVNAAPSAAQQAILDALMDESLKSHRVQACDGERVTLHCPRNTHIMIETGFYGRVVPPSQLCPERRPTKQSSSLHYDSTCDVIHAQSKLSELCDKKRKCTINVDSSTFEDDPCPSTSKYLQMSYKCKPISFDGESFCEGSEMQLECREGRRLAIYSADYGRTRHGQAAHCAPAPTDFNKDCTRDALRQVLAKCHAQEGCSLSVADRTFGNPCPKGIPKYLNIIFMCVNEEVFSEEAIKGDLETMKKFFKYYEGADFDPLPESFEEETKVNEKPKETVEKTEKVKVQIATTTTVKTLEPEHDIKIVEDIVHDAREEQNLGRAEPSPMFSNDAEYMSEEADAVREGDEPDQTAKADPNLVGVAHDVVMVIQFIKENKEKVILCVALSTALALILLLIACLLSQFCSGPKKDKKVRYSIERSALIAKSNQMLNGPNHLIDMGDLGEETFLRYSLSTPPRSTHYDF